MYFSYSDAGQSGAVAPLFGVPFISRVLPAATLLWLVPIVLTPPFLKRFLSLVVTLVSIKLVTFVAIYPKRFVSVVVSKLVRRLTELSIS